LGNSKAQMTVMGLRMVLRKDQYLVTALKLDLDWENRREKRMVLLSFHLLIGNPPSGEKSQLVHQGLRNLLSA
jgi:hypothetical protein